MKRTMADWSTLPDDLLTRIAQRLDLIDLLHFRSVCKDWYFSSLSASGRVEYEIREACLLLYGEGSKCTFFHQKLKKKYTIEIPELEGTTCIASGHGWILLFKTGSVFFFCPFSRAKIHLPDIPGLTSVTDHLAMFSAPPTSKECTVFVFNKLPNLKSAMLEVSVLNRGDNTWTKYEKTSRRYKGEINGVFYHDHDNVFYCISTKDMIAMQFTLTKNECVIYHIVPPLNNERETKTFPFRVIEGDLYRNHQFNQWIMEDGFSSTTSICGFAFSTKPYIITRSGSTDTSVNLKGVWIQPRFFQLPKNQNWSQL